MFLIGSAAVLSSFSEGAVLAATVYLALKGVTKLKQDGFWAAFGRVPTQEKPIQT